MAAFGWFILIYLVTGVIVAFGGIIVMVGKAYTKEEKRFGSGETAEKILDMKLSNIQKDAEQIADESGHSYNELSIISWIILIALWPFKIGSLFKTLKQYLNG